MISSTERELRYGPTRATTKVNTAMVRKKATGVCTGPTGVPTPVSSKQTNYTAMEPTCGATVGPTKANGRTPNSTGSGFSNGLMGGYIKAT